MRALFVGGLVLTLAQGVSAGEPRDRDDYIARMEREHATDQPSASPAAEVAPRTKVVAAEAVYGSLDERQLSGFVAHPASGVPKSGILVIHEWWGLNDNIRSMARRLAGEGYLALAVDLYEGEVAEDRETAARLARGTQNRNARLIENLRQAIAHLEDQGVEKIGAIGWCFGGGWSLRTALEFPDKIDATVIYYGRLLTEREALAALASPVLGLFGDQDRGIPVASVRDFQLTLDALGKNASIHIYEGAGHAFANPSGTNYEQAAAEDAWSKTLAFFGQHLRP